MTGNKCEPPAEPDPALSFHRDDRAKMAYYADLKRIREAADRLSEGLRTGYHPEMIDLEIREMFRAVYSLRVQTKNERIKRK